MLASNPMSVQRHGAVVERAAANTQASSTRSLSCETQLACDCEFIGLLNACRRSGGLARTCEIALRLGLRPAAANRQLNHWIHDRRLCYVQWAGQVWIPRFQFEPLVSAPMPQLSKVIAEWAGALNDFELCFWFVTPNAWLGKATPAETLADLEQVCNAARADRFVRCG